MRLGIVKDLGIEQRLGGAQVAMQLFEQAAPKDVELVQCRPGNLDRSCDAYITGLVKFFSDEELNWLCFEAPQPQVRYSFDWWEPDEPQHRWSKPITERADMVIFPSPLLLKVFNGRRGIDIDPKKFFVLPPPLDLELFRVPRAKGDSVERRGAAYWGEVHPLKGIDVDIRWANNQYRYANKGKKYVEELDYFDIFGPQSWNLTLGRWARYQGAPATQEELFDKVCGKEWFIHFPRHMDGMPMAILEAQLLGLKTITSGVLGIESWYEATGDGPEQLIERCALAAESFWDLAGRVLSEGAHL